MEGTGMAKRAKQTRSSIFEHDLVVRTVLQFVGATENIYAAAISKRWRSVRSQMDWRRGLTGGSKHRSLT